MQPPLLTLQNIALTFGGTPLLERAELSITPRDRLCLVGRNGSGKSTLLKIAAGTVEPDSGERFAQPGQTIRYLPQEPDLSGFATIGDYVRDGLVDGDAPYRAQSLMEALEVDDAAAPLNLSGGEARRAALARTLAPEPDILLLDEPTNHLDLPAIEWLERELAGLGSALVLISHDRRFLETLGRRVVWVDRGETRTLDKGFEHFEAWRDDIFETEATERHKLDRKIARETHWLIHGVSGRRKRNMKRLSDLGALKKEKARQSERGQRAERAVAMEAQTADPSARRVFELDGVSKAFDGRTVVADFSLRVMRGDRIGFVGANGSGKTTLIKMITGGLPPDEGTSFVGQRVEMVTLDQKRESLAPSTTLRDALTGGGSDMVSVGGSPKHVMSYMKDFLFLPEQAGTPIERLSGGERGRLMLARAFSRPSNALVLDEPTNDLDLETLDLLQELLADYAGTVLLVSHDRDFLDRVVMRTVHHEGAGRWQVYAGGYSDMLLQRAGSDEPSSRTAGSKMSAPARSEVSQAQQSEAATPRSAKLTYKDQYSLERLPDEIADLETEIAALNGSLADGSLFTSDPAAFEAKAARLAAAEEALAEKEERWLELEMKREALESD